MLMWRRFRNWLKLRSVPAALGWVSWVWAISCITVGVRYGSEEAQEFSAQVMEFVRYHCMVTSG